jgi:hypothetical protein
MSAFRRRSLTAALFAAAVIGAGAAWAATPPAGVPDLHTIDFSQPKYAEAARLMQAVHEVMETGPLDPQTIMPRLQAFAAELAKVSGTDPKATEAYVMQEAHEMIMAHADAATLEQIKRLHGAPAAH